MLQVAEQEKLELEAVVNQQRREDGCASPPVLSASRDDRCSARLFLKSVGSDLRSSMQSIRDALDARHRVLFASILSR
jgi:hypothetical protein